MLSVDTHILLYSQNRDCAQYPAASAFLEECADRDDVAIAELVLLELYQLLRNPAVITAPLEAADAASVCQAFRANPRWALLDGAPVMDQVWRLAAQPDFARGRVFDAWLALTLRHHGVRELATAYPEHYAGFGFDRVFDPLSRR